MNPLRSCSCRRGGAAATALLLSLAACQNGAPATARPSVTVFPALLAGQPNADVAGVVGVLLERGGTPAVELAATTFRTDPDADLAAQATAFAAFAPHQGLTTDYALLGDFRGTPGVGVTEVRGVLVDRAGRVVWSERQTAGSPAFDSARPREPMDCCVLLVQRLTPTLQLDDPMRRDAPEGRLAARFAARAGVPPESELAAMATRRAALRQQRADAVLRVHAPRLGDEAVAGTVSDLVAQLERAGWHAVAAAPSLAFAARRSSNEQEVLWSAARAQQAAVRAAPTGREHHLFVHLLAGPGGRIGAVHTFLLAPDGEFELVDYQNDHHPDFQGAALQDAAGGVALAGRRLVAGLAH